MTKQHILKTTITMKVPVVWTPSGDYPGMEWLAEYGGIQLRVRHNPEGLAEFGEYVWSLRRIPSNRGISEGRGRTVEAAQLAAVRSLAQMLGIEVENES